MTRRLIDSTLSQSDKFNDCPDHFHRILYVLLIAHADPYGRGDASPQGIKYKIIPGLDETKGDIFKALNVLHSVGLIVFYEVCEKLHYAITQWEKFQSFNESNRRGISKYPDIPESFLNSAALCGTVYSLDKININKIKSTLAPDGQTDPLPPQIEFNFETSKFENVTDEQVELWQEAFPASDVRGQILKAAIWAAANPKKRKKDWKRFLGNWVGRNQEQGGDIPSQKRDYSHLNEVAKGDTP